MQLSQDYLQPNCNHRFEPELFATINEPALDCAYPVAQSGSPAANICSCNSRARTGSS